MSDREIEKEAFRTARLMLLCFIGICILLIIISYVTLINAYQVVFANGIRAELTLNTIQFQPTVQPVVQFRVTSHQPTKMVIIFDEDEFQKLYESEEGVTQWQKSVLLPKELFGRTISVRIGDVNSQAFAVLSFTVSDAPLPEIAIT